MARWAAISGICALASCASQPRPVAAGPAADTRSAAAPSPDRDLVAIVDGDPIGFAALRTPLVEMSGDTALREAVVDARLARRLAQSGIAIGEAEAAREQAILLEALSPDRDRALELLGEVRARQGLGDARFAALLRRNAGLRALVAREVTVDEAGIAATFDTLHGPKRRARIAVLASLADAERFRADLDAGRAFAELAAERSRDESAARGGLIGPLARRDQSYPEAVRAAVFATEPGRVSPPVLDGARFHVVQVIDASPADGTSPEAARARCEELLRRTRERLLMDALARELASREGMTVFDRAFDAR